MTASLPRLLLISELPLGYSRAGLHVNPILYNLFRDYPPQSLLHVVPDWTFDRTPPAPPFVDRTRRHRFEFVPTPRNRLGLRMNPWLDRFNRQWLDRLTSPTLAREVREFSPDLVLIVPITPWATVVGHKFIRRLNVPSVVYFMDHPAAQDGQGVSLWPKRTAGAAVRSLLVQADGWLVISEPLIAQLSRHYRVDPPPTFVATNTIDLSTQPPPTYGRSPRRNGDTFRIAYAGSIQPMHFDAVLKVAEAVAALRRDGRKIELVLHTLPVFWETYRSEWQRLGVVNGGLLAYAEFSKGLQDADLLLVATSFAAEHEAVVRSSVLTKTFDYMATGRPLLSYGPAYAANNEFVARWRAGLVFSDPDGERLKTFLDRQLDASDAHRDLAERAYGTLQQHFDRATVNRSLQDFLSRIAAARVRH